MYDDCFLPRHGHRELFFLISTWTIVCLCLAFIFLVNKRFTKRGWQKAAITRLDQTRPGQEGVSSRLGRPLPSFFFFTSAPSFHGSNWTHSHAIKYFSILFLFADLSHINFRPILQISTVSSSSPRRGLSSDDAAARLRDLESRGNGFQTAGSTRLPAEL